MRFTSQTDSDRRVGGGIDESNTYKKIPPSTWAKGNPLVHYLIRLPSSSSSG